MKKFFLTTISLLPLASFATPNLFCAFLNTDYPYMVVKQVNTAVVRFKNEVAPFGYLECTDVKNDSFLVAQCTSTNVADAGFQIDIKYSSVFGYMTDLYTISFVGTNLITTLPCLIKT